MNIFCRNKAVDNESPSLTKSAAWKSTMNGYVSFTPAIAGCSNEKFSPKTKPLMIPMCRARLIEYGLNSFAKSMVQALNATAATNSRRAANDV
jgi:hypothetical protein